MNAKAYENETSAVLCGLHLEKKGGRRHDILVLHVYKVLFSFEKEALEAKGQNVNIHPSS